MSDAPLKGWNHTPNVPLQVSPFFSWPPRPVEMVKWVFNSWFFVTEKLILVGIAFISFYWFQPPLEVTRTLALAGLQKCLSAT